MSNIFYPRVIIAYNGDFYCVHIIHGITVIFIVDGMDLFLPPNTTDAELGDLVLMAYQKSAEFLQLPECPAGRMEEWIESVLTTYKYKNKRRLFALMKSCEFSQKREKQFIIMPMNHYKLEAWGREKGDGVEDVFIPIHSTPDAIGKAIRRGFSRCIGPGAD